MKMKQNYYIDFEFLEGKQDKRFLGIKYGETKPTIDIISVGIVSGDNREYYAISKDFNLKEAWNRYDLVINKHFPVGSEYNKVYWIRDNVLFPIYKEYISGDMRNRFDFSYSTMKWILNNYGKSNKQIAEEIREFVYNEEDILYNHQDCKINHIGEVKSKIEFYGYYSAFDYVAFSWLFGRMIDLPNGFPMIIYDLKQLEDDIYNNKKEEILKEAKEKDMKLCFLNSLSEHLDYPKQTNEHNSLSDAKFNKRLHEFLSKYD